MVKRIDKVKISKTEEQTDNEWGEVFSHRNKLLLNSDWTQLPDAGLTEDCVVQFRGWRKQLKTISRVNYSNKAVASQMISSLEKKKPFVVYVDTTFDPEAAAYTTLDEYRNSVVEFMESEFNTLCNRAFLDNQFLVEEQFKEAVDYKRKNGHGSFPLIHVTTNSLNISEASVVDEFISRKVKQTKRLVALKKKYYEFQLLVSKAETDVELADIQRDLKKWILTLT